MQQCSADDDDDDGDSSVWQFISSLPALSACHRLYMLFTVQSCMYKSNFLRKNDGRIKFSLIAPHKHMKCNNNKKRAEQGKTNVRFRNGSVYDLRLLDAS